MYAPTEVSFDMRVVHVIESSPMALACVSFTTDAHPYVLLVIQTEDGSAEGTDLC